MLADFAVREQTLLALVHELDGVLDRDHVLGIGTVDLVDDCRERCGLARTRGSRDKNEPLLEVRQALDGLRERKVFERHDLFGDQPKHRTGAVLLYEIIRPEPRDAVETVRKVRIVGLFELRPMPLFRELAQELTHVSIREHRPAGDGPQLAMHPDPGLESRGEVEVGAALGLENAQKVVESCHPVPLGG